MGNKNTDGNIFKETLPCATWQTKPIFLPDDGEVFWSILPSLVSLQAALCNHKTSIPVSSR